MPLRRRLDSGEILPRLSDVLWYLERDRGTAGAGTYLSQSGAKPAQRTLA
jgi:hypothetical protein